MADVVMPRLSDTMEEGTILQWLKRDGEEVRRGEELVEIERGSRHVARIKRSPGKASYACSKQAWRLFDEGRARADLLVPRRGFEVLRSLFPIASLNVRERLSEL